MTDGIERAGADEALVALVEALRRTGYVFTTPAPATHARVNARPGNERAQDLAGVFGWSRPSDAGVLGPDLLALAERAGAVERRGDLWHPLLRVSSLGRDLLVHSAYPTLADGSVFFGPDTYRFARAIGTALARRARPVRRAVDIGCGAGPGAIVVGHAHPEAEIVMVDINDAALRLAAVNARLAGLGNLRAVRSDLLSRVDGRFDLVVSNPPYLLDPARRAYRHGGGERGEGLSLAILDAALDRLAPGGTLLLYTGVAIAGGRDPFRDAAAARLDGIPAAWSYEEMDPDVFGEELDEPAYRDCDRIAAVVLTVTTAGQAGG